MTPAARVAGAIEVLADILERRRPAPDALKDWGLARRFAGSKDRAAIASLVYDALRRRASSAWVMEGETARALTIGMLAVQRGLDSAAITALFSGERFAPEALSADEMARLDRAGRLDEAPAAVACDCPEWLLPSLTKAFGSALRDEMLALTARAPLDVRVNSLKSGRRALREALAHLGPEDTPLSPFGLRFPVGDDGRGPALQAEPEFLDGMFEIQDEGSQLVSLLSGPAQGSRVVDLCAGAGGKTLALAALMENTGEIIATDVDARRLVASHARLQRSGATNVTVRTPRGRYDQRRPDPLADLAGTVDLVLVDAPCTGSGTWRRNPDAKWRLRPGGLAERCRDQAVVLDRAAALARPGGRIAYITCSVLPDENDDAISAFQSRHSGFALLPTAEVAAAAGFAELTQWTPPRGGLLLSPHRTGTDAFYIAMLRRQA
ncbi:MULTISPECIES: RsmB/NOP family class I SAM-dependent RNA methyltransferase [unclassified Chelatococcus]|uniref:RsmB/NOP family class I SAM-dependent RNA methyltransferase n=1 Tax=unclassified Chelatococcus TaxID=2638111 RepID=UPI001BCF25E8|nr:MULTISPECIES: RsmB/NOP family class I SAM-dependent RNA methyltransferase [unclassified Chelatococcus]CAH1672802.1 putative 16S rRNA (cytosine(967)-C(5))-methyltransferase [Hyphomicrobiales bacterium]MBS7738905.1 RsmB/NOP family class I SAM-dependent RNA methyltransferase [Chelatococcus sp. HY11]MBX3543338.1 RsmB/NOP family class I SAM-dependent RNA methyltransferase [Chelatococcus sp.]MCO5076566.1 RsmB/NOP family class I SAM-dependent RNA methyltransferase [Chelatococcus sp.]CAH1674960.1 p